MDKFFKPLKKASAVNVYDEEIENAINIFNSISDTADTGVGKGNNRSHSWFGTYNNYTEERYQEILTELQEKAVKWIICKEVAPTTGTPHLHMYARYKNARYWNAMRTLWLGADVDPAKGNDKQGFVYCSKDGDFKSNYIYKTGLPPYEDILKKNVLEAYNNVIWRDWQNEILTMIEKPADSRSINWYWEETGNVGKSFLSKYIISKYPGAIIADGKKDNVFNQVMNLIREKRVAPTIVLLDIPRCNLDRINYGVLEALKNGMMYSGKYEGGVCVFAPPHVIVFANAAPNRRALSQDRWMIKCLEDIDSPPVVTL